MNRHAHAALGATGLCAAAALVGTSPGGVERAMFRFLNRSAGPAERPIWTVMQLGNGLSAVAAPAVLLASGAGSERALRTGVAAFGGWQLAKVVKRLVPRERPNALLDDVRLRDGDPTGCGFVSGHATVAMAVAASAAPALAPRPRRALYLAAMATGLARVHVGAHLPLDVLGGAGLGALWGVLCGQVAFGASPGEQ